MTKEMRKREGWRTERESVRFSNAQLVRVLWFHIHLSACWPPSCMTSDTTHALRLTAHVSVEWLGPSSNLGKSERNPQQQQKGNAAAQICTFNIAVLKLPGNVGCRN